MTFPKNNLGAQDAGADRDEHVKPCCHRMLVHVDGQPVSTWCVLSDAHSGPHEAPVARLLPENAFGPEQAQARKWGR